MRYSNAPHVYAHSGRSGRSARHVFRETLSPPINSGATIRHIPVVTPLLLSSRQSLPYTAVLAATELLVTTFTLTTIRSLRMPPVGCTRIPLHFHAFAASVLLFIVSAIMGGMLWSELSEWPSVISARLQAVTIVSAVYYSLLMISTVVGFFSVLTHRAVLLKRYAFLLGCALVIHLTVSALRIWTYFDAPHNELFQQCASLSNIHSIDPCMRAAHPSTTWILISAVGSPLFQLAAVFILSAYGSKLMDEDCWTEKAPLPVSRKFSMRSAFGSKKYKPVAVTRGSVDSEASIYSVETLVEPDEYTRVDMQAPLMPPVGAYDARGSDGSIRGHVRWDSAV